MIISPMCALYSTIHRDMIIGYDHDGYSINIFNHSGLMVCYLIILIGI